MSTLAFTPTLFSPYTRLGRVHHMRTWAWLLNVYGAYSPNFLRGVFPECLLDMFPEYFPDMFFSVTSAFSLMCSTLHLFLQTD